MQLDFEVLELRTRYAFHIARMKAPPVRRTVWIRLRDGDGLEGWGEAAGQPYYGESVETVLAVLPRLGEALEQAAGEDPLAISRAERALERALGGNAAARAGLSAALHDLVGKRLGLPVWRLWGLDPADAPLSSFTLGLDTPEVMRQKLREAADYPILKLKVGTPEDEKLLKLIRDAAPHVTLRVDANTGWTVKEAMRRLPMLEEYRVELVEQPLPAGDLDGLALLRRRSRLPIIADESCKTAADVARLAGVVDGINIKLEKCGSLREALRMVHVARAHGLQVMLGCMLTSTLGIAAALQLAPLVDYVDLDAAALLAIDPFDGPGLEHDGRLRFNQEAGLGVSKGGD